MVWIFFKGQPPKSTGEITLRFLSCVRYGSVPSLLFATPAASGVTTGAAAPTSSTS
jgi:hypothetical protein